MMGVRLSVAAVVVSAVSWCCRCNAEPVDILRPLPAAFEDTPVVLLQNNLAVIPGNWEPGHVTASFYDAISDEPAVQSAFDTIKAAQFIAWDEDFLALIGPNAHVERIQSFSGPHHVHEAPAYVPATNEMFYSDSSDIGNLWAINVDTHEVRKVPTTPPLFNINGATYHEGSVYVTTNGGAARGIYRVDPSIGAATPILNNYRGRRLNSPNDLIFDSRGNILFTDPPYGWTQSWLLVQSPELPLAIYHFDPSSGALRALSTSQIQMPNGLALSPDESTLYVANSNSSLGGGNIASVRDVWAFDYDRSGPTLRNPRVVYQAESGWPDGVRVSENGFLMVASAGGVDVVNPDTGLVLGKINTPSDIIYNLEVVPGKGSWILTGRHHIYKVSMRESAPSPAERFARARSAGGVAAVFRSGLRAVASYLEPTTKVAVKKEL